MKADIELFKMVLTRNEVPSNLVAQIIEDINAEVSTQTEEKAPPVKKQFAILISDPEGDLPEKDFTGWVIQIPEDDGIYTTEERLVRAAYNFNQTPKGRRMPVKTIGETCEHVSQRLLKEENVWVKTKEPVFVLKTTNQIPFDTSSAE